MSTIKVNNIVPPNVGEGVSIDGLQMPTAGPLSNRNKIINGAMTVDQRNQGSATAASYTGYTLDRFRFLAPGGTAACTIQQVTSNVPAGFTHATQITVASNVTPSASQQFFYGTTIEANNIGDLNYGTSDAVTTTLSFFVRCSVVGTFSVSFTNDANDRSFVGTYSISSADTWEYKTITIPGDTTGSWTNTGNARHSFLQWDLGAGSNFDGTAGVWQDGNLRKTSSSVDFVAQSNGSTFMLTGVQLEVGSKATPFEHENYGQTLSKCQRYYYRSDLNATSGVYGFFGMPIATAASVCVGTGAFAVTMRAAPDVDILYGYDQSGVVAGGAATAGVIGLNGFIRINKPSGTFSTGGTPVSANFTASAEF